MEIIPKLTLLQNPRVVENGSIVQAKNIIFDSDNTLKVDEIYKLLSIEHNDNSINFKDHAIIEIINTDDDLILFTYYSHYIYVHKYSNNSFSKVLRYSFVCDDTTKLKIHATYIYNGYNDLIITYNEEYPNSTHSLKIININNKYDNITYNDLSASLSINKLIFNIPTKKDGKFYAGVYNIFIRCKNNNGDSTNWINIINNYELYILKSEEILYLNYYTENENGALQLYDYSISDYILNDNYSDQIINLNIPSLGDKYSKFQIGVVIQRENDIKTFISNDLIIKDNYNFELKNSNLYEYNLTDLLTQYEPIFNCKSLISYNNCLYCGNFEKRDFDINNVTDDINCYIYSMQPNDIDINKRYKTLIPGNKYKFYIHFVDKFGKSSKGYKLTINSKTINGAGTAQLDVDTDNDGYSYIENFINHLDILYELRISVDKFPIDCIGYFITYEEIRTIEYAGIIINNNEYNGDDEKIIYLYNDNLNINPAINSTTNIYISKSRNNIGGNTIERAQLTPNPDTVIPDSDNTTTNLESNEYITWNSTVKKLSINNIEILVADDIEKNKGFGTRMKIKLNNNFERDNYYYLVYCEVNKKSDITRCSNLITNTGINGIYNFKSKILYTSSLIFNYQNIILNKNSDNIFYDKSYKSDDEVLNGKPIIKISTYVYSYNNIDLKSLNNKPDVVVKNDKIYKLITQKDTIDLYKNEDDDIQDLLIYDIKTDNDSEITKFPNTIIKSEPLLDESKEIGWRKFNSNVYKNITNNKGNIIKLINSGNVLLIHTTKTLFLLDGSDTIKTTNDGNIQLSSIDIWDVNFKELIPSQNAYAGLKDKDKSILGEFGYIWYNEDKLLKFDNNNQLSIISDDIYNYLKQYDYKITSLHDDWYNNRLFIQCTNNIIISYNYKTNSFISTHDFGIKDGITINKLFRFNNIDYIIDTSSNFYSINKNNDNQINGFIDIIFNDKYDIIKYLEYIRYKLIIKNYDFNSNDDILLQNKKIGYPGNSIRIYSEYCDTNDITITTNADAIDNSKHNLPYWDLGTWNFNNIRNKIKDNTLYDSNGEYKNGNTTLKLTDNEQSLLFGNYFVVRLNFDTKYRVGIDFIEFHTKQKI